MAPRLIATVVVLGGIAAGAPLTPSSPATVHQGQPVFSARSELVVLHVTVKDKRGAYVPNLTSTAFSILEDERPQTAQFFDKQDAPVTAGLVIDSSGSMLPAREQVIAAAMTFAQSSNPGDEMFALAFNEAVHAAFPPGEPFTSDPVIFRAALFHTIVPAGRTALYDAVAAGLAYVSNGSHERKVLIIVSDGGDNASAAATFDGVLKQTQASNTVIYTVALPDRFDPDANPKRLKGLAEASGGEAFAPEGVVHVEEVLRHIAADIRNTYTLGYVSTNTVRDNRFRRVRVIAKTPDSQALVVRTRRGYVVEAR